MNLPDAIAEHVGDRRLVSVTDGQSGAAIFRVCGEGVDHFLKIGEGVAAGLVVAETQRLRWLAPHIACPAVVAADADDDRAWLLTTALAGTSALLYIKADRQRATTVARDMAMFLRRLHALPVDDCPFDASVAGWLPVVRKLVEDGQVDTDDFDDDHAGWSAERVLAKVEGLAHHAQAAAVLHGDFSMGNVIVGDDGRIAGCIDVGRLGVGDPYRDIVIGWRDIGGFGEAAQRAFLDALGIEQLQTERCELHRALDELF